METIKNNFGEILILIGLMLFGFAVLGVFGVYAFAGYLGLVLIFIGGVFVWSESR